MHVHHVGVTVEDLDRTLAFYRDVLGFEVLSRFAVEGEAFETAVAVDGASASFAHLDGGDTRIELVEYDPADAPSSTPRVNRPGTTHVGVAVDDVDAVFEGLSADVETLSAPRTTASGTRILFVRDPEGNLVELLEA